MGYYQVVPDASADLPETVLSFLATKPVQRVLIEKVSQRSIISLQCDGGSIVGDVPPTILKELDRKAMLPSMLGSYLRDMGYL